MFLQFGFDSLILGDALEGIKALFGAVCDQKDVAELSLSELFHDFKLLKLEMFTFLIQVVSIDFLLLHDLEHRGTVVDCFGKAATELIHYLF